MEVKKSPKADLENKKGIFIEIGLIFVLVICLVAFNLKSYDEKQKVELNRSQTSDMEEKIINTAEEELPPPPPPEPEAEISQTQIEVTTDTTKVTNLADLLSKEKDNITTGLPKLPEIKKEEAPPEEEIFVIVEDNPSFPGGEEKMLKFLYDRITYPPLAKENNIQGKVTIEFVVEPSGKLSNFRVHRDIGGGCGAVALEAAKQMPPWTPGKQRGKAVRVQVRVPIDFKLK